MSHPVLSDPDTSTALTLTRFDGTLIQTRGIVSRLDETGADIKAAFVGTGPQAWVDGRFGDSEIEYLTVGAVRWRVLAVQPLGDSYGRPTEFASSRLQLAHPEASGTTPAPTSGRAFGPGFDPLAFA